MKYRDLGKAGPKVSEIGHGTWAMGHMWGPRDDAAALDALRRGMELGINLIDTALVYGEGHAERLVAQVWRESSVRPMIATKCPPKNHAWPAKPNVSIREVFPAEYFQTMTETSLRNLGVDCLDLQQFHVWNDAWLEQDEWRETVLRLKQQGKIRYFGVSLNDHDPDSGIRLVQSGVVDSIQVIFNLFEQEPRKKLFPLCLKYGVGVIVRVPFDEGALTGQFCDDTTFEKGDWRSFYFKGDRLKQSVAKAAKFDFLLRPPLSNLAQAALKFCLSEPAVSTVIPGMRSRGHVEANVAVSELPDLSKLELQRAHGLAWRKNFYPAFG